MRGWFGRLSLVLVCVLAFGSPAIGANKVIVESKTVAPGATGVNVGVFVENDDSLGGLTLPLDVRSISGGAYITNTFDWDTVPGGRVGGSGLSDFITHSFHPNLLSAAALWCSGDTLNLKSYGGGDSTPVAFFTSPDAVLWSGVIATSPGMAPGGDGSTPSFMFTFDVNSSSGVFEIDTCCIEPANVLTFVDIALPPTRLPVTFTKGVITVNAPPVWDSIGAVVNRWGDPPHPLETARLRVTATDPEGDSLTLTDLNLPDNATFSDSGNGVGGFEFTPDSGQEMTNAVFWLIATDEHGDADTCEVVWSVGGLSAVRSAGGPVPESYVLDQNYPNPFNAGTLIPFSVGEYGHVRIAVYNILGNRVVTLVDEELVPGRYTTDWDGRSGDGRPVATGIYFYRILSDGYVATRKMLLLK